MSFFNTPQQGFRFLGHQICTPKAFRYMGNFTRITLNNPPSDFDLSTMWLVDCNQIFLLWSQGKFINIDMRSRC